jgi:hypothetical protein
MTLIEQLDRDRARITEILNSHKEKESQLPSDANVPADMLYKVYIDTLEDSLKTLNSMIDYLRKPA